MSKLLEVTNYSTLSNWSVAHLLESQFQYNKNYKLEKIGSFLKRNKTQILIDDNIEYKRVTIKLYNKGVFQRDQEIGKNIGTKKQFLIKEGQFLLSKIDARNGAFGLATNEVDGAIITADFFAYDIDTTKVEPYFLVLMTTTKKFQQFSQSASSGTTGRQRIDEKKFLEVKIPLPSLEVQKKIVQSYQDKLSLSAQQEKEAEDKEKETEEYLYKELGITLPKKKEKNNSLLEFISYKNTNTWSYEQLHSNSGFHCNSDIECIITSFDRMCTFKKKQFKKKEYDKTTFDYIDIGSVEPLNGILKSKEININKAPSRATQHINTGDLIIATTRPYLKKFAIVYEKYNEDVCSSGFTVIEYNPTKYNLEFVKEFLQSFYGIEQLKEKMTGGLYPAITLTELKTIKIPNPDIQIQNKIALHIKQLKDEIKSLKEQSMKNQSLALKEFEKEIFNET